MPPLACNPDLEYVSPLSIYSIFDNIPSSSDDGNKDGNPPPPPQDIPLAPQLPRWVRSTQDVVGSLAGDPKDRRCTRS